MENEHSNSCVQKISFLDKKLIGYSLAAGAILAGGKAHAAVQYTGPVNQAVYLSGPACIASFPGGIEIIYVPFPPLAAAVGAGPVQNAGSGFPFIKAFNYGATIGPSRAFGAYPYLGIYTGGQFPNQGQKYIGIFDGARYGWIRVTVFYPPTPNNIIVHDWAYEDISGLPILAGSLLQK